MTSSISSAIALAPSNLEPRTWNLELGTWNLELGTDLALARMRFKGPPQKSPFISFTPRVRYQRST